MKREEEREQMSSVLSSNKQSSQFGSLTGTGSDNVSNIPLQTYQTGYRYVFAVSSPIVDTCHLQTSATQPEQARGR